MFVKTILADMNEVFILISILLNFLKIYTVTPFNLQMPKILIFFQI